MTTRLAPLLGVGERELVAFVGAGGKSTLMVALGRELAAAGSLVVITTTTKMGSDQVERFPNVALSAAPADVETALQRPEPVLVLATHDRHKVTGPPPEAVDALFAETRADFVLVEADGARGRSFKAPAKHEPVIPQSTTLVVVVFGADALGRPIRAMAHRPELVAALAGCGVDDRITPELAATVLGHREGGLQGIPPQARTVVAITKAHREGRGSLVAELSERLTHLPEFERVTVLPEPESLRAR